MKISYECGACFLRQAREAMDLACDDEMLKLEIMNDIFNFLAENFSKDTNSNKTGSIMHNIIKSKTGCEDPYYKEKIQGNEIALKYLPDVKNILEDNDSLENYVKIAIIGNILDFGAFTLDDDIDAIIKESLNDDLAIKDIEEFENSLERYNKVLYLVDNTGEIVFDKLLMSKIKEYGLDITIAVKSEPILNDACMKEALEAGADIIMLDNMSVEDMTKAVELCKGKAETECSGNVTKENVAKLTRIGVNYISSGALTHSSPILDLSLKNLHAI